MTTLRLLVAMLGCVATALAESEGTLTPDPGSAAEHHRRGVEFHLQRRLDEASREYAATLGLEPAREATPEQWAILRAVAPRLFVTPAEPFGLKDAAAVLHPTERLIAFHLFWDDDIDFPDDNDPCDHEVVWVRYGADGRTLEAVWTYFHDHLLDGGDAARAEARQHSERPRVNVQWGKHGSLPVGWETLRLTTNPGLALVSGRVNSATGESLLEENRRTWKRLTQEGHRALGHGISKRWGWPEKFVGTFEQFTEFTKPVDLLAALERRRFVVVSRWNSAAINQEFLPYNFRPKTEWPVIAVPR